MARKAKLKTNKEAKARTNSPPSQKAQPHAKDAEEENPMDFGGIPNRDLKKNLGCG